MTGGQKRRIMPKIISEQEKNEREEYILAQAIALFDEMDFFDIIFLDDRGKNAQTLHDLEISPSYRKDSRRTIVYS